MLLLYTQEVTTRLQYIVNFFSDELFDKPIRITDDRLMYTLASGPRLNYSPNEASEDEFSIVPVPLLFEKEIRAQEISCFEINFHKTFFQTDGDLHFDIFAASFYLMSRYEEYLPHEKDEYGRYSHTNSLAHREGFLQEPLINIWIQHFRHALTRKFPDLIFKRMQFANVLTYDVDIAYAYLGKGWLRNLGGAWRSLIKGQLSSFAERIRTLMGFQKDPYDCYEWLDALHLYCRLKPYYFFLVAKQPSEYDKNISPGSRYLRELIEYYAAAYHAGVHPSWQSGDNEALLNEEIEWMSVIADKEIVNSRQHYIRLTLPVTYRHLAAAGIREEFSMGYGSANGFRASVCSPFTWYDLEREKITDLRVHSFCFMDANALYEHRYTPGQAYAELMKFYETVKKVNGSMVTIWHNHLLGQDKASQPWRKMFEVFMKETVYWDAYYD